MIRQIHEKQNKQMKKTNTEAYLVLRLNMDLWLWIWLSSTLSEARRVFCKSVFNCSSCFYKLPHIPALGHHQVVDWLALIQFWTSTLMINIEVQWVMFSLGYFSYGNEQ